MWLIVLTILSICATLATTLAIYRGVIRRPGRRPRPNIQGRGSRFWKPYFDALDLWYDGLLDDPRYANLPFGTYFAVHPSGSVYTAPTLDELNKLIKPKVSGYPTYEFYVNFIGYDEKKAPVYKGRTCTALGGADDSFITYMTANIRSSRRGRATSLKFMVDDGSTHSQVIEQDLTGQENPSEVMTYQTANGIVQKQTLWIFIVIDGLVSRTQCSVADASDGDPRLLGLNVIHRYKNKIDYRWRHPRVWRRRSDLTDD